jgi:hypothetical protein
MSRFEKDLLQEKNFDEDIGVQMAGARKQQSKVGF